ncbi:MAG: condensation domain-containing protein [Bacteroidota bacterium]
MNTKERTKVDAILPLSFMQVALLFHSLSANDDQGFIHVKVDLIGSLDVNKLRKSWDFLAKRHDVFRSSVHWEKIKSPVQVIHKEVDHQWQNVDLRSFSDKEKKDQIVQYLIEDKNQGFDFNKATISRIRIFQLADDRHLMVWSCHHLLWDGWSSANVIRELAEVYKSDLSSHTLPLAAIPSSKEYFRDQKENDTNGAKSFWNEYMKGFESPSLVSKQISSVATSSSFETMNFAFHEEGFEKIDAYAKNNNLTITSVLQMAWSIVLNGMEKSNDVAFGNILSVRSPRLKNAELMCGLFTNMLPVRVQLEEDEMPAQLAAKIQKSQGASKDYAFASLDELQKWTDWPGYMPMFDHVFVVENFPWKDIDHGNLKFSNFRSGITSSYPLTVVVKVADHLSIDFIYDGIKLSEDLVQTLGKNMSTVLNSIIESHTPTVLEITERLIPVEFIKEESEAVGQTLERAQNYTIDQPSNPMELALTGIWENLFQRDGIGINDNFFEIGGKSLLAVRLFQKIQTELDVNAPPIIILKYPTIAQLANYLGGGSEKVEWKSLVPLRVKGKKKPLFCLHAKGGHVFFYNKLASYLNEDQPIYALQPRGLNGEEAMYTSIEEMAGHYIEEIKSVQAEGPYNILATCFSNAVGLEMAQQLMSGGDRIGNLFMVDAAPGKNIDQILDDRGTLAKMKHRIKQTSVYHRGKEIYYKMKGQNPSMEDVDFSVKHEKHLERLFYNYERKPYDGKITLIRSTEFMNMKRKDFHVEDWLHIVKEENLHTHVVEGHHQTMFLEPEVQGLAAAFNEILT